MENVLYRNITMTGQENGCRVKTYSDKAGRVRNITWDNIVIKKTGDCVTVNANYKPTPTHPTNFIDVQDLTFRNIVGTVRHHHAYLAPFPDETENSSRQARNKCEDSSFKRLSFAGLQASTRVRLPRAVAVQEHHSGQRETEWYFAPTTSLSLLLH
eukprot:COSAG06_NODE_2851_length_6178_cov_79.594552_5_plen_156_part_00